MRPVASLRQGSPLHPRDPAPHRKTPPPGRCSRSSRAEIVVPGPSYRAVFEKLGLGILPDLWTPPGGAHEVLGRRPGRAAHRSPQARRRVPLRKESKVRWRPSERRRSEETTTRRSAPISVHHRRNRCSPSSGTSVHLHRNTQFHSVLANLVPLDRTDPIAFPTTQQCNKLFSRQR